MAPAELLRIQKELIVDIRQIVEETLIEPARQQAAQLRFEDNVKAIAKRLDDQAHEMAKLRALNAELVSHLKVIVDEYDNTYDVDQQSDGYWHAAASIPVETMEAASRLLERLK